MALGLFLCDKVSFVLWQYFGAIGVHPHLCGNGGSSALTVSCEHHRFLDSQPMEGLNDLLSLRT